MVFSPWGWGTEVEVGAQPKPGLQAGFGVSKGSLALMAKVEKNHFGKRMKL